MKQLSPRKFAELVGASLAAVQAGLESGRLSESATRDERGRWHIAADAGLEEWSANAPVRMPVGDAEALHAWREARARKEAAQAALAEDELRRKRGQLIEAGKIEAKLTTVFSGCRNKLLGVPSRARQQDPTLTAAQLALLEQLIREALEDLAAGRF